MSYNLDCFEVENENEKNFDFDGLYCCVYGKEIPFEEN
jgi:hypothetical protein